MTYTIDGNSCIKGGSYTLTSATSFAASISISTSTPNIKDWSNDGDSNTGVYLENPSTSISPMTNSNDITKAWCTIPHTISTVIVTDMAYTIYATAVT